MQKQKQIDVNWDHREHTRPNVQTGFQTAGILGNLKKAAFNPIRATRNQWRNLTGGEPVEGNYDPVGFDRFGTPTTDDNSRREDENKPEGPLGVSMTKWIIGGGAVAAIAGVAMVYTGDDNSLDVQRFNPRNSN